MAVQPMSNLDEKSHEVRNAIQSIKSLLIQVEREWNRIVGAIKQIDNERKGE